MFFETGHVYHIFNQGNNRQQIFFSRDNYLFFLKKIKSQIIPFADILAWCLMPNHFHLLIHVNRVQRKINTPTGFVSKNSLSDSLDVKRENEILKNQTLSQSIGILLSSYTRAVNLQIERSGSLFRKETKAISLTKIDRVSQTWLLEKGITRINNPVSELQYPNVCFNYIILNPVKDGLVKQPDEWEFSSYKDIVGLRNGSLISRERIKELRLKIQQGSN
jgi:putative transposase